MGDARRSASLKKALVAFLRSSDLKPPPKVDAARARTERDGLIAASFARGSVMLVPDGQGAPGPMRLLFAKAGEELAVPAGTYRVKNYSIEATEGQSEWLLSATGAHGRQVEVVAGETAKIEVPAGVKVQVMASRGKDGIMCCAGVKGDSGMGVTILRDRQRIPFRYDLLAKDGRRVHGDDMAYN